MPRFWNQFRRRVIKGFLILTEEQIEFLLQKNIPLCFPKEGLLKGKSNWSYPSEKKLFTCFPKEISLKQHSTNACSSYDAFLASHPISSQPPSYSLVEDIPSSLSYRN